MHGTYKIVIITRKLKGDIGWSQLFYKELSKYTELLFTGKGYENIELTDLCSGFKPHVVLVPGIPCRGNTNQYLNNFNKIDAIKVHIIHDYHIFNKGSQEHKQYGRLTYPKYDKFIRYYNFDLLITYNSLIYDLWKDKFKTVVVPLSYDPEYFYPDKKEIDLITSSASNERFYENRKEVIKFVSGLNDLNIVLKHRPFLEYINLIRKSKIFVNSGSRFANDGVLIKYLESMASGTLMLTTKPNNLNDYGFVDGEHLVIYDGFDDLKDKIYFYLENEDERAKITEKARKYVSKNFTNTIVVKKMLDTILSSQSSFIR